MEYDVIPHAYRFTGSIGFQQQQVADAVPPLLAKAVAEAISHRWLINLTAVSLHKLVSVGAEMWPRQAAHRYLVR